MDFLKKKITAAKQAVGQAGAALHAGGAYAKVVTSEEAAPPTFSIDDADDSVVSMEQLASMHDAILGSAKTAITDTESSVSYLREQRDASASRVRELLRSPPATPKRGAKLTLVKRACCCARLFSCCRSRDATP